MGTTVTYWPTAWFFKNYNKNKIQKTPKNICFGRQKPDTKAFCETSNYNQPLVRWMDVWTESQIKTRDRKQGGFARHMWPLEEHCSLKCQTLNTQQHNSSSSSFAANQTGKHAVFDNCKTPWTVKCVWPAAVRHQKKGKKLVFLLMNEWMNGKMNQWKFATALRRV